MVTNRSVPAGTVLPHIVYQDLKKAIAWLTRTFGFVEHYRYGDPVAPSGAQIQLGNAWLMMRRPHRVSAARRNWAMEPRA